MSVPVAVGQPAAESDALLARVVKDMRACPIRYYRPRSGPLLFTRDGEHSVRFCGGGNQSSKSFTTTAEAVMAMTGIESLYCEGALAKFHKPPFTVRHWCTSLTQVAIGVLLPIYQALVPPDMLDQSRGMGGFNRADSTLYLRDGSFVEFLSYGMAKIKRASATRDAVVFDEPPPESLYLSQYMRVAARGGRMWGAMTLDESISAHPIQWVERRIIRGGDGPHVAWYTFDTRENFARMAEEAGEDRGAQIERAFGDMENSLPADMRRVMLDGLGGWLTGVVFKEFDAAVHCQYDLAGVDEFVARAKAGKGAVWCGLDHGMRDPTAVTPLYINYVPDEGLQLAEGDAIQFDEYEVPGMKIPQHILALKRKFRGVPIAGWVASNDLWNDDAKGGVANSVLYIKAGFKPFYKASKDLDGKINSLGALLRVPVEGTYPPWPRLRFSKGVTPKTKDELLAYHYVPENERTGAGGDKTVAVNDHLVEALGHIAHHKPAFRGRVPQPVQTPRDLMTGMPANLMVGYGPYGAR